MSWSLESKCFNCVNAYTCKDNMVIANAISVVHALGEENGHLGAGAVTMDCQNFTEKSG